MSVLLLDLGNSRWKLACSTGAGLGPVSDGGYDDLAALHTALRGQPGEIVAVWLAGVVDAGRTDAVIAALGEMRDLPIHQVRNDDPMPNVVSGYRRPRQLGVDRLLAMVAARAATSGPLCVVDAGTAITIDFVDRAGQHLGGFILPGLQLARRCLLDNTAIPRDARVDEDARLGRDTPTAVALGARQAVAGIVERFTRGSAALFENQPVQTVVGGGDADRLVALLPRPCSTLDHLVLRGLAVVAAGRDR